MGALGCPPQSTACRQGFAWRGINATAPWCTHAVLQGSVAAVEPAPATLRPPSQEETQPGRHRGLVSAPGTNPTRQPSRTTVELIAKRASKALNDRLLTRSLMEATNWRVLEQLYHTHKGQMNHIHMSALMTRLAHLTAVHSHPSKPHPAATYPDSVRPMTAARLRKEGPAIRMLLSEVVPFIGMHLLSLGPRQLASVMWALGSTRFTPQRAWVVEWSGCVARRMDRMTPQDLGMSAWGLAASGCLELGTASGAPGVLLQIVHAATQPHLITHLLPQDVCNMVWALASTGIKPQQQVLHSLAQYALLLMKQPQTSNRTQHAQPSTHHQHHQPPVAGPSASGAQPTSATSGLHQGSSSSRAPSSTLYHDLVCSSSRDDDQPLSSLTGVSEHTDQAPAAAWPAPAGLHTHTCRFTPVEVTSLVWAFARLGFHPGAHLLSLSLTHVLAPPHNTQPAHSSAQLQPHNYSVMLWSVARLKWRPPADQVAALLSACLRVPVVLQPLERAAGPVAGESHVSASRTPSNSGQEQPSSVSGPGSCRLGSTLYSRLPTLPAADLVQVVWSLGVLQYRPAGACRHQLMHAVHVCLTATAKAAGVRIPAPEQHLMISRRVKGGVQGTSAPAAQQPRRTGASGGAAAHDTAPAGVRASTVDSSSNEAADMAAVDDAAILEPGELAQVLWGVHRLLGSQPLPLPITAAAHAALTAISPDIEALPFSQTAQLVSACAWLRIAPPPEFRSALLHYIPRCLHNLPARPLTSLLLSMCLMRLKMSHVCSLAVAKRVYQLMHVPGEQSGAAWSSQPVRSTQQPGAGRAPAGTGAATSSIGAMVSAREPCTQVCERQEVDDEADEAGPRLQDTSLASHWQGEPTELVVMLWALARLGTPDLGQRWAAAAVQCAVQVAPVLKAKHLARLVGAMSDLGLHPPAGQASAAGECILQAAAARAAALNCDVVCSTDEAAGHLASLRPACVQLAAVPDVLTQWLQLGTLRTSHTNPETMRSS